MVLILFPLCLILREALYLCLKCMIYFSKFMTFWTRLFPWELGTQLVFNQMCLILFPGSIMGSGLHSSPFFTVSGSLFLLVNPVCMAILIGLCHRLRKSLPWVCLSLFPLIEVARPGHELGSIFQCRRDLYQGLVVHLLLRGHLTWRLELRLIQVARSLLVAVSPPVLLILGGKGSVGLALLMCCSPQPPHHLHLQFFRLLCFSIF